MSTEPLFRELFAGDPSPTGHPLTGEELRDSGIASVINHTPEVYRDRFVEAIKSFPRGHLFTVEDVRAIVGDPPPETHYNCVGGLMRSVAGMGLVRRTLERRKAKRPSLHASELVLWRRL